MPMKLSEMAAALELTPSLSSDPVITSLTSDSRRVEPGALFAAIPGTREDGLQYVSAAVQAGAVALLLPEPQPECSLPQLVVKDVRDALARLACAFYGNPAEQLMLVGITGTNGKTTTGFILQHLFNHCGVRSGLIGTVAIDTGAGPEPASMTTPDSVDLNRYLRTMADAGCGAAVTEVSSHALDQSRVAGVRFAAGVFTNLTRDHLDYHGDMEAYAQAKARLFQGELTDWCILNQDDPYERHMADGAAGRIFRYGMCEGTDLRGEILEMSLEGTKFRIHSKDGVVNGSTYLIGVFNVHNLLAAVAAAYCLGIALADCLEAVRFFPGVPGRLERIEAPAGPTVFVDYAHTDDALKNVLAVLRPLVQARLIVVFGCGGDRDRGKRPLMAQAAEEVADHVVVTSDNPRTEDPEQIVADIRGGFTDPEAISVILDRAQAVREAIAMAGPADTVLLAGKGHEDYQVLGTTKVHLDDRELAREALNAWAPGR
ncbi:MAG: UDP-N-acetylmuramoyl-L-alanyl-D-glutamate--2,6-diaminopimelate ligase [Planctomycetota bacterium]|jgi:UDP-N-acetylmuramoyl-L-alanyl-D-glutamate--2,6-diaminopimelate ligase